MKQIERDLPEVYVRRDDFKELKHDMKDGFNKIDSTLGLLFKKLETKLTKE
jgi:tetrahydromethanopterin S-methyltransferase subunit G